jgi:probable LLM family oxidoreductase
MELGLYSFVENTPLSPSQEKLSPEQRIANLIEEIVLADQVGLSIYGIGEHHREEYLASAPPVLLAAAAVKTNQIRLSSAVTVLGSEDPVRVYQQFATLDLLSKGRAEIIAGRGSFIESFPLFGYDLQDYDDIFSEHLDLLLRLREQVYITWKGKHRPDIQHRPVYPRSVQATLPVWIAVGGTPPSAYRAGALGLPMALAIIGGNPANFVSFAQLHRRGATDQGLEIAPLSINSHGFIADDSQKAREIAYPALKTTMDKIGRERGWPPMTERDFEHSTSLYGANFVGSPQQIIEKIHYQYELFGHDRFLLQMSVGSVPHRAMLRSIELFGTIVKPAVESLRAKHSKEFAIK